MWSHPLVALVVGLTGTLAHPGPSPASSSSGVPTSGFIPKSCLEQGCPVEQTPVWDSVSQACICRWSLHLPEKCSDILCIAEKHVVYHQETNTCGCEWIPGFGPSAQIRDTAVENIVDPATCPTVRCKANYHAVYIPGQKNCNCEPNVPEPSTCPTIKCTSTTHPVYNPETKGCSCQPNPPVCPTPIFCAAGCHTVQDPATKKCTCEVTNPIPKTCPQFKCLEYHHVVYNPDADKCQCVPDCPDLMCIAEAWPIYDYATNSCSCKYIPGLEPSSLLKREAQTTPSSTVVPSKPATPTECISIMCIPEKRPVFNATSGHCECQWINGFEPFPIVSKTTSTKIPPAPTATTPVDPTLCLDTMCISEQRGVYNATTAKCTCEWIPGLEPGVPSTLVSRATTTGAPLTACSNTICISEMQPIFNSSSGVCECDWIDIFRPASSTRVSSVISSRISPVPTPTRIPSCVMLGYYCIPEMRPTWNETSGRCECQWIPGLGPVPISSALEKR